MGQGPGRAGRFCWVVVALVRNSGAPAPTSGRRPGARMTHAPPGKCAGDVVGIQDQPASAAPAPGWPGKHLRGHPNRHALVLLLHQPLPQFVQHGVFVGEYWYSAGGQACLAADQIMDRRSRSPLLPARPQPPPGCVIGNSAYAVARVSSWRSVQGQGPFPGEAWLWGGVAQDYPHPLKI